MAKYNHTKKRKPNPRRAELRALSQQIKPLVKAGQFDSVNDGLVSIYSEETGQSVWHTFSNWKKSGTPVKHGEKGFPIWATPRKMKREEDTEEATGQELVSCCLPFPCRPSPGSLVVT